MRQRQTIRIPFSNTTIVVLLPDQDFCPTRKPSKPYLADDVEEHCADAVEEWRRQIQESQARAAEQMRENQESNLFPQQCFDQGEHDHG